MRNFKQKSQIEKVVFVLFYLVATVEILLEYFSHKSLLYVFKPLIPLLLMILYWVTSPKKSIYFLVTIFFALITDVFFIPNTQVMIFFGLLFYFINRVLVINCIVKYVQIKDYVPLLIGIIPFLFIFFYLLCISTELEARTYYVVIVQNILISILGGIILSHYMMFYSKRATWLFIFGLLSVTQYFIVFIEKYYLSGVSMTIFRPLAMILNTGVYFSFYKYILANERLNNN